MKKNVLIKLFALLLVVAMLVTSLVACGEPQTDDGQGTGTGTNGATGNNAGSGSGNGSGSGSGNGSGSGSQTTGGNGGGTDDPVNEEEELYKPAAKNYGNVEFKIFAGQQQEWGLVHHTYLEGLTDSAGGVINDALYDRQLILEGLFGVIMTLDTSRNDSALATYLGNQEKGGKAFADQIFMKGISTMTAGKNGQLTNLLTLSDTLNLKASYYDQRIQQDYRVNDLLFQMTGDFDTIDELVTFGLLYNDKLYSDFGYYEEHGSPYEMVKNYEWTYERMLALSAPVLINDDNQFDIDDTLGMVTESQAGYYFFLGSGIRAINTSEAGVISVTLKDGTVYAKTNEVLNAVADIFTDSSVCIPYYQFAADAPVKDASANKEMFINDRALFRSSSLSTTLNGMPDMKSDFGILPIPMYESSQQAYYCSLNDDANKPLIIPRHVDDLQRTAEITEIISYYSRYGGDESLYESFFERLTIAKICRKEEDRAMLILIFSSKVYDMDRMLGLMDIYTKVTNYTAGGCISDITSTIDSALKTAPNKLNAFIQQFQKNNTVA